MSDTDVLRSRSPTGSPPSRSTGPERRNALQPRAPRRPCTGRCRDLDADDDVDVVILTGADPAFCAGLDLKELGSGAERVGRGARRTTTGRRSERGPFPLIGKPVIGAINGVAVTGGFELALRVRLPGGVGAGPRSPTPTPGSASCPDWGLTRAAAPGRRRAPGPGDVGHRQLPRRRHRPRLGPGQPRRAPRRAAADCPQAGRRHRLQRPARPCAGCCGPTTRAPSSARGDAWSSRPPWPPTWQGGGLDPAAIEARRAAVTQRGRAQV